MLGSGPLVRFERIGDAEYDGPVLRAGGARPLSRPGLERHPGLLDGDETRRNITVPTGMLTDLASVPRPFRWYAGRVGPHLEAAVVHDFLYRAWQDLRIRPTASMRRFADRMMLTAMLAAGMCSRAHSIYRGVRLFGCGPFHDTEPCRYVDLGILVE